MFTILGYKVNLLSHFLDVEKYYLFIVIDYMILTNVLLLLRSAIDKQTSIAEMGDGVCQFFK